MDVSASLLKFWYFLFCVKMLDNENKNSASVLFSPCFMFYIIWKLLESASHLTSISNPYLQNGHIDKNCPGIWYQNLFESEFKFI